MPEKTFLDAAYIVLNRNNKIMSANDIIDEVLSQELWIRRGRPDTKYNSLYGTLIKTVQAGDPRFGRIGNSNQFYSTQPMEKTYKNIISEELTKEDSIYEGLAVKITVNRYERSQKARAICLDHYGTNCSVCNFNFSRLYGEIGKDFIHVHHIIQISNMRGQYKLNPIRDLRPVCPNCHAMIHRGNPPLSIDELKILMSK